MSLQTTYLTGGNWATRQVNIGDIMASRQGTSGDATSKPSRTTVPITGVLSRTVIPGPMIQRVLPARIRHRDKHDIVFVGDDFIQVKELVAGGHLEDIATKADFDTKILDAKVIGSNGVTALEAEKVLGAELGASASKLLDDSWHRQILVLVLASKELLFLYGTEGPSGNPEFTFVRRPLPSDVSSLEQYGRYIAIDPSSRAMAISAAYKFFGVFSLKLPSVIRSEMEEGPVNPIWEERFFRADGDIVAIDFLYPAPGDDDRVVLVLLVNNLTQAHFACYTWRASEGVSRIEAKRLRSRIPAECRVPSLFIPLTFATSFLLVIPGAIYVFEIKLADSTALTKQNLPDPYGKHPFIAWVRPRRNISHHEKEDNLYLCRENGELGYFTICRGNAGCSRIESIGCNVDRGFAILDSGFEAGGDILIVAGSMGDGGLFVLGARKNSRCLQRIPNWAPVLDSVLIGDPSSQTVETFRNGDQAVSFANDRIFTCSWNGLDRGWITELRHGIEARAGLVVDQEDFPNVLDIWAFPNPQAGATFFLFSNPMSSSVMSIPLDADDELYMMDEDNTGFDLDRQTIAAGSSREGVFFQITDSSLHLSVLGDTTLRYSTRCQNPDERIIAATVNGSLSLFAIALKTTADIHVHLRKVAIDDSGLQTLAIGQPLPLSCEPVSMAIEQIYSQCVLFIGTTDGNILVARVDPEQGLVPVLEQTILLPTGNDESKACESLMVIKTPQRGGRLKTTLFCGLRSGVMVSFKVQLDASSGTIALPQIEVRKIGKTFVRMRRYESDSTFAIVTCGRGLWKLSHVEDKDSEECVLHKIWVTDQNNLARTQPHIDVFTCIDTQHGSTPGGLWGSLVCIMGNQMLCCALEKMPKTVTRKIAIPGIPKRIIYSKYLKRLVLGYTTVETEMAAECIRRWRRPRVDFIDPDGETALPSPATLTNEPDSGSPDAGAPPWRPTGGSGEEITGLLDWCVINGKIMHHMIVVTTAQSLSPFHGRVVYIIARPNAQIPNQIDSTVKHVFTYDRPVRSIAPFKPSSLVLGVGQEVIFQTLDPVAKTWRKLPKYILESDAVAINVREPFIYVLTLKNSLCILKVTDTVLTLHGQDGSDREGLDLVSLEDISGITMTSNLGGAIVGLSETSLTRDDKLLRKVFTAHMPLSVIRLSRSSRPRAAAAGTAPKIPEVAYGTTIDGTVYRFMTLSENQWRLLRFIQNVCMQDASICPLTKHNRRKSIDMLEVTVSKPESLHVNGDILGRLTEGGIGMLRRVMGGKRRNAGDDEKMVEDSRERLKLDKFLELAAAVVPNAEDPFVAVMAWMSPMVQVFL
ncbi:uncharacterized protein PADG_07894 [Paracoccidioides brasiliensis Pb18]|uniref:RSE1/DDB1/CPSF1 first beta-propeller domain-containing protein n=1 Tax=Paracoccidioides brasiliensis (strain Pb18) TaxID=502780 RepID=C1GLA8_PARBD|nr:uncharacterized protein PADG_07894 [Paracoccidioides brasiliensis Pb18]EEH43074.2 hypothetical protein PADG_07894 [Paracoccidioides brasiliensis Pb18]